MKRLFTVLFGICLLYVLAFSLSACGDNENVSEKHDEIPEVVIPKDRNPFVVTDLFGTLSYDEDEKEWIIYPELEQSDMFIQLGDCVRIYMIVSKMKKEYESYVGSVSFSGKVTLKHNLLYNAGNVIRVYTVELTNVSPIKETDK